jgi:hypothetical protein
MTHRTPATSVAPVALLTHLRRHSVDGTPGSTRKTQRGLEVWARDGVARAQNRNKCGMLFFRPPVAPGKSNAWSGKRNGYFADLFGGPQRSALKLQRMVREKQH